MVMAYTVINFKTKKALKEAIKLHQSINDSIRSISYAIRCYQPGLGPDLSDYTGSVALEGPHYPKAHTWYAAAELKNGIVVKVK